MAAADDDGLVADIGVIAFFYTGIKGIAIHVGDGKGGEFRVGQHARRAAGGTSPCGFKTFQTITAKSRHGGCIP